MRRPCISAHPTSVPRKRQRLQMRSSPASATRPFRHKRAVSRASAPAMGIRVTEKRTGAPRRERDRSGKLMSIGPAIPWEESRPCPSRRSVALGLTKRVSVAGVKPGAAGAAAKPRQQSAVTGKPGCCKRQLGRHPTSSQTNSAPQEISLLRLKGASLLRPCWDCDAPRPSCTLRHYHTHHLESMADSSSITGDPDSETPRAPKQRSRRDCRSAPAHLRPPISLPQARCQSQRRLLQ